MNFPSYLKYVKSIFAQSNDTTDEVVNSATETDDVEPAGIEEQRRDRLKTHTLHTGCSGWA